MPMSETLRKTPLLAGLLLALLILALPAAAQPRPEQAADLVEQTFNQATAAVQENQQRIKADPTVARELMRDILAPRVDFELLSRLVLAQHWRTASPQQRERFVAAFTDSLLDTYAVVLSENLDEIIAQLKSGNDLLKVQPVRAEEDARRVTVRTELNLSGNRQDVAVDYALRADDQGWQVFDVIIEGVSFVTSRRGEVASLLRTQSLDQLIQQLESNGQPGTAPAS